MVVTFCAEKEIEMVSQCLWFQAQSEQDSCTLEQFTGQCGRSRRLKVFVLEIFVSGFIPCSPWLKLCLEYIEGIYSKNGALTDSFVLLCVCL